MSRQWVTDRPNILSPESLLRLQEAFQEGIIFGIHWFYCGGGSPDHCAFITYKDLLDYLKSHARPGDLFELWSLPWLLKTNSQFLTRSFSEAGDDDSLMVSVEELEPVKKYLQVPDPRHSPYYMNEVRAIYYSARDQTVEARIINFFSEDDWEGDWKEVLDDIRRYSHPGGEVHLFPEPALQSKAVLEAKYPNDKGEVPIGGSY